MWHSFSSKVRAYPRVASITVTLLFLLSLAAGFYAYVLFQWQAAKAAVQENRLDEAADCLKICLFVWPRSASVHVLAARIARMRGDFEAAEEYLDFCLSRAENPKEDVELEYLLLRVQKGDVDMVAPRLLVYVRRQHRDSPLILETLAHAYLHNLRYGPALDCLNRWIEVEPDRDEPYYLRGWLLEQISNPKEAMQQYQQAIALNPEHDRARLRLAELGLQMMLPEEAQKHLVHLQQKYPDRPDILSLRGQCRYLQGDLVEARRLLETAAQQLSEDIPTWTRLARLELKEHHPEQAERWLRRALKRDSTDLECQYLLVNCLEAQGRREPAEMATLQYQKTRALLIRVNRVLQQELRQPTNDADALCEVGELYLLKGQDRLGEYWLHQALSRDQQHQRAHQILADHYQRKGNHQQAAIHRQALGDAAVNGQAVP